MAARRLPIALLSTLPCLFLIVAQSNARAEGFLDLYLGTAGNWRADASVSETTSSGTTSATATIDLPSTTEFGIRIGAWVPAYNWFGMGIDLGYSRAESSGAKIRAYPMSLFLALRAPLFPTSEISGGRLQPYAMGGLSFYITDLSVEIDGLGGSSSQISWPMPYSGNSTDKVFGPYLAAGLAWQPTKRFALFGEFRHTSFDVGYDTANAFLFPTATGRVDSTVRADRVLLGISYRFETDAPQRDAKP